MPHTSPLSRTRLAAALTEHRLFGRIAPADLTELPRNGLAHRHWRLRGRNILMRTPVGADAQAFERQLETFRRAGPSGHVPELLGALPPAEGLPGGVLLVEAVRGRAPRLPEDLRAIARALAAIHDLPVPPLGERAPLPTPAEPFVATLATIERHFFVGGAICAPACRRQMEAEIAWAREFANDHVDELRAAPRTLVLTDTHPRNFIIRADGRAIAVDLEKGLYGAPSIDLAHAVLPASIAWGRSGERVTEADRRRFYEAYFKARGHKAERALKPLLPAMQRLTWLRTTVAFAAFRASKADRVMSAHARTAARRAIADALDPDRMAGIRRRWAT